MVPRPHHLALDGKIFRADDPFWMQAAPPNGWGCQCSVEGVSEREMKRMGKDGPDTPPADWAPDEGWDYAPGASVADDINRMIAAKAGKLPQQIAGDLAAAVRTIPSAPALPTLKTAQRPRAQGSAIFEGMAPSAYEIAMSGGRHAGLL